jgi:hypothetical protein
MVDVQNQDVIPSVAQRKNESGDMAVLGVEMWDRYRSRMLRSSRWRFRGWLSDYDLGLDIALVFPKDQN